MSYEKRSGSRLHRWLDVVGQEMLAHLDASGTIEHQGSKGTVREARFEQQFLRRYLPRTVESVGSGEAFSVDGQSSGQCDCLIVDPTTPPLYSHKNYRLVPAECVFGSIEVKSFLDGKELEKAWEGSVRLKRLPKTAFFETLPGEPILQRRAYGKTYHHMPTMTMVFAYDSIDLVSIGKKFRELLEDSEPDERMDSIWVLNKGCLLWFDADNRNANVQPKPHDDFGIVPATPGKVLAHMVGHLHEHFCKVWTPGLRIRDYLPSFTEHASHVWEYKRTDDDATGEPDA